MATSLVTNTLAKNNINSAISTSTFSSLTAGSKIQKSISLDAIQTAVNKLSTYIQKVDNCGNCKYTTLFSTYQCSTTYTGTKTSTVTKSEYYYNTYSDCSGL